MKYLEIAKNLIWKNKALILVIFLVSLMTVPSVFASKRNVVSQNDVLGIASESTPIPSPTSTPTPTPTSQPTFVPVSTPIPTPVPTQSAAPTPSPSSTSTPTSAPTSTPAPTGSPTPTPTPTANLSIKIGVDYAGEKSNDSYPVSVDPGKTAWEVVSAAVGLSNLKYTDYGGDLGVFITSFNGIDASSNQFYDFKVNGVESQVGVSSYTVKDGDQLDFVLTSF